MNRLMSLLAIGLACVLLSACSLTSDEPLLPTDTSIQALGDAPLAIAVNLEGTLLTSAGAFEQQQATWKDGRYAFETWLGESTPGWFSLHRANGAPYDYLMQVVTDHATYYAVKLADGHLYGQNIELDQAGVDTLEKLGVQLHVVGEDQRVADADELRDALRVWTESNRAKLTSTGGYSRAYFLATDEDSRNRLMAQALNMTCLAAAGRPDDPDVAALPGKFAKGVDLLDIDKESGERFCGWIDKLPADDPAVAMIPDSVRLARLRVLELAKNADIEETDRRLEELSKVNPYAILERAEMLMTILVPDDAEALLTAASGQFPILDYYYGKYVLNGEFDTLDELFKDKNQKQVAFAHFQKAADAGIPLGWYGIGRAFIQGDGVDKDEARGFDLLRRAEDAGVIEAASELGEAYYFGTGTKVDFDQAFKQFTTAAETGNARAEYALGMLYARGEGTDKNSTHAIEWLAKAMDDGNEDARAEIGWRTYKGLDGYTADESKGKALLEAARDAGSQAAVTYLNDIEEQRATPATELPPLGNSVPAAIANDLATLAQGNAIKLTRDNRPFMAGLADYLAENCGLPDNGIERASLAGLIMGGTLGQLGSIDFANPNLGEMFGDVVGANGGFLAGGTFAAQLDCHSTLASNLADGLVKTAQAPADTAAAGGSVFVNSCSPAFDTERCTCLARQAENVIPDIYDREYSRTIFPEIVNHNPLLGMTIAFSCGITEY